METCTGAAKAGIAQRAARRVGANGGNGRAPVARLLGVAIAASVLGLFAGCPGDEPEADPLPGLCLNTCSRAGNGICQDGVVGAASDRCDYGTDCDDCGRRTGGETFDEEFLEYTSVADELDPGWTIHCMTEGDNPETYDPGTTLCFENPDGAARLCTCLEHPYSDDESSGYWQCAHRPCWTTEPGTDREQTYCASCGPDGMSLTVAEEDLPQGEGGSLPNDPSSDGGTAPPGEEPPGEEEHPPSYDIGGDEPIECGDDPCSYKIRQYTDDTVSSDWVSRPVGRCEWSFQEWGSTPEDSYLILWIVEDEASWGEAPFGRNRRDAIALLMDDATSPAFEGSYDLAYSPGTNHESFGMYSPDENVATTTSYDRTTDGELWGRVRIDWQSDDGDTLRGAFYMLPAFSHDLFYEVQGCFRATRSNERLGEPSAR